MSALEDGSRKFGRYVLTRRIGRGGMGDVWLATFSGGLDGFHKRVVVKTILANLAGSSAYVDMFINEASIAAELNHPNVIQVLDLGLADGVYYIAMEYLPGRTLHEIAKRGAEREERLPVWLVLHVIAACCDGLQHVHDLADSNGESRGIVHQDVCPRNILVTFTGNVKLLDFGIASARASVPDTTPTSQTVVRGKHHYMAPERIRGSAPDRSWDVFSTGVTLYQLLSGARPFPGRTDVEIWRNILNVAAPPIRELVPDLAPDVAAIVMRAIEKDPARRYQDAGSIATDIRAHLRDIECVPTTRDVALALGSLFDDVSEVPADIVRQLATLGAPSDLRAAREDEMAIVPDVIDPREDAAIAPATPRPVRVPSPRELEASESAALAAPDTAAIWTQRSTGVRRRLDAIPPSAPASRTAFDGYASARVAPEPAGVFSAPKTAEKKKRAHTPARRRSTRPPPKRSSRPPSKRRHVFDAAPRDPKAAWPWEERSRGGKRGT